MDESVLIPLAAIGLPMILVPTIITLKHAQRRREWEHKERMRALELGQPPHDSRASTFWPTMAAAAIGAGVPIAAFFFCFLTSLLHGGDDQWRAAAGVGVVSVICGSVMVGRILSAHKPAPMPAEPASNKAPLYDPDVYDTVGRRG